MAMTAVRTRRSPINGRLDFSFSPKCAYDSETISPTIATGPILVRQPSRSGLSVYPTIQRSGPSPTHLPEIQTPLTPLDRSMSSIESLMSPKPKGPTLLTIPLEIRLQIYSFVLHSHPVHHAHLSPITTSPSTNTSTTKEELHHTIFRPQGYNLNFGPGLSYPNLPSIATITITHSGSSTPHQKEKSISITNAINDMRTHPTMLSISQPIIQCKLPTSLLSSCKQIYEEARLLPWHENHFAFVNWFWSGVYAARQFSRGVRSWQSDAMRWASVEVLGRDLWMGEMARLGGAVGGLAGAFNAKGAGEWRDLCGMWKGVWGLRLGVKGSIVLARRGETDGTSGWNGEDGGAVKESEGEEVEKERGLLNTNREWIQYGLLLMRSLRWIQLEIEDESISRDTKLSFCQELGDVLNEKRDRSDGWTGEVKVIFVERVELEEEPLQCLASFGGEAADNAMWGASA